MVWIFEISMSKIYKIAGGNFKFPKNVELRPPPYYRRYLVYLAEKSSKIKANSCFSHFLIRILILSIPPFSAYIIHKIKEPVTSTVPLPRGRGGVQRECKKTEVQI